MTILLCPVRPGDDNEELRYAARSWETNLLLPNLRLMTVGHVPSWLKPDWHVAGNRYKSVPLAVFDNIRLGTRALTERNQREYLLMNDDFFCLYPTPVVPQVKRDVNLRQHALMAGSAGSDHWFPRSLRETDLWLRHQAYTRDPWSYEVHSPMWVQTREMHLAIDHWVTENVGQNEWRPQARSLYGNAANVQAIPVVDCKLGTNGTGVGSPWISTSDQSWRKYRASLVRRFQKPSRWER